MTDSISKAKPNVSSSVSPRDSSKGSRDARYISFRLGGEEFGIPLLVVKEVLAVPKVTSIPSSTPYFLGITDLRGQVISIIDLRLKLGLSPVQSPETAVIICDFGALHLGIVVDSIDAVFVPKEGEVLPKPQMLSEIGSLEKLGNNSDYISGVYRGSDRLILLLDISRCLSVEDWKVVDGYQKSEAA